MLSLSSRRLLRSKIKICYTMEILAVFKLIELSKNKIIIVSS